MATPPARTQSLLSQALGKRPAAPPAGARPSASGGPMVDGVRLKQQKASEAEAGGLLGEAQRTLARRPAFKGGFTPRNSLGAANIAPTPHPASDPDDSAIPCGDVRRGGRWRDNCQLACCSTAAAIRRNAYGSPVNSDDTDEDEEDGNRAAVRTEIVQSRALPAGERRAPPPCGASGGPRPSGGGGWTATSDAAAGAACAAAGGASAAAGARGAAGAAPAPSATAAAAAAGAAGAAGAACAAHRFVWAEELTHALEAQALPLGTLVATTTATSLLLLTPSRTRVGSCSSSSLGFGQ